MKQATSLGTWLSSRSTLYTNIIMQKLGIFHHKLARDSQQREHSFQYYQITDMESLAKFPSQSAADGKDWTRASNRAQAVKSGAFSWTQVVGQAMRDAKPSVHLHVTTDPIVKAAHDLQDLRHREKKIKGKTLIDADDDSNFRETQKIIGASSHMLIYAHMYLSPRNSCRGSGKIVRDVAESRAQHTDIVERPEHVQATLPFDTLLSHAPPLSADLAFAIGRYERPLADAAVVSPRLEQQCVAATVAAGNAVDRESDEHGFGEVASGVVQIDVVRVQAISADLGL